MSAAPSHQLSVPKVSNPDKHWLDRGCELARRKSGVQWEIGDWWLQGHRAILDDVAEIVGLPVMTLLQHAWVARVFPPHRRRDLSYSHHVEVGGLPDEVADQLLDAAREHRWSVARIREDARAARRGLDAEALRQEHAEQRRLALDPDAAAWRSDAKRVERECRERLIAAEASVRSVVDAVRALAEHPGAGATHGNRRRATAARLRSVLAPMGDTGIDLTAQMQPLLDAIWAPEREDGR